MPLTNLETVIIEDDGVEQGAVNTLDFTGNITATVAAGKATISATSGSAPLLPTTGTGTATGAVVGDLAGNSLDIINATTITHTADTHLFNGNNLSIGVTGFSSIATDGTSTVSLGTTAETGDNVRFTFNADDGTANPASIVGDGETSSITHTADSHNFAGPIKPTADDSYALGDDTHRFSDIFLGPGTLHVGTSTSDEASLSYNTTTNVATLDSTGTIAISKATTFAGDIKASSDNARDIGDATNSFKDIYSRTLKLDGSTSGTATITAPATAGTPTLTLPTTTGTLALTSDIPAAGANTALSNLSSVAVNTTIASDTDNTDDLGTSSISWKDIYARRLRLDGSTSGTVDINSDALANTPQCATLTGTGVIPSVSFYIIQGSDFGLQDNNGDQSCFPAAGDVWTLQGSTTYYMEGQYYIKSGASSHSIAMGFTLGGSASINSILYSALSWPVAINTATATQTTTMITQVASTAVNSAGANAVQYVRFYGHIRMNVGGTVTPIIKFSAAPGGVNAMAQDSYIRFTPVGSNTVSGVGPVA